MIMILILIYTNTNTNTHYHYHCHYRRRAGSLDAYLRDKTDISLLVKKHSRSYYPYNSGTTNSPNTYTNTYINTNIHNNHNNHYNNNNNNNINNPNDKFSISAYTTWSNATSTSLVSEYMVLMCHTIGK